MDTATQLLFAPSASSGEGGGSSCSRRWQSRARRTTRHPGRQALYSASSQVLLKYQNLASGLTGIQDLSTVYQDPQRVAQTQTQIAMSPGRREPGRRGRQDSGADPRLVPRQRKRHCGDRCGHPELRHHLRRRRDGRKACDDPRRGVHPRTGESSTRRRSSPPARSSVDGSTELEQTGFKGSPLVARLVENEQALRTMEALQTANASLLRPASGAAQIQPRTKRAVVLGVMLGLMLGHRARLRPRCPRHACSLRDGDRRQARDDAARADRRSAERSFAARTGS